MEASKNDSHLIPSCPCGSGKMQIKPASAKAHHPGRFYYRCPSTGGSCGFWKWCDEFHEGSNGGMIPHFLKKQVIKPSPKSYMSATSNPKNTTTSSDAPTRATLKPEDHIQRFEV